MSESVHCTSPSVHEVYGRQVLSARRSVVARTERTLAVVGRLEERQARVVVLLAHVLELFHADGAALVCVVVLHHVYPPDVGAQEHPGSTASRGRGEAPVCRELWIL